MWSRVRKRKRRKVLAAAIVGDGEENRLSSGS